MASSRPAPSFLNPVASKTELDRFLTEAEFPSTWERLEGQVIKLVKAELTGVSLHRAESIAAGTGGVHRHLLAGVGAVRQVLRGEGFIIPDIVQEVRIAMWRTIRGESEGNVKGLRASVDAIRAWLRTTIHFITKRYVAKPAMLVFAAGSNDSEDESQLSTEPAYCLDLGQLTDRGRDLDRLSKCLTPKQLLVVRHLMAGYDYAEIAELLGISESYARVLFHRARRKIAKLFGTRDGPRNGRRGGARDFGSMKRRYGVVTDCNYWDLLTTILVYATIEPLDGRHSQWCRRTPAPARHVVRASQPKNPVLAIPVATNGQFNRVLGHRFAKCGTYTDAQALCTSRTSGLISNTCLSRRFPRSTQGGSCRSFIEASLLSSLIL
jgi:RNA polymerase sigma factor (sigma-70 family)